MKLLNTSTFPYQYIKLILNNYFTSFHIVCENSHDTVLMDKPTKANTTVTEDNFLVQSITSHMVFGIGEWHPSIPRLGHRDEHDHSSLRIEHWKCRTPRCDLCWPFPTKPFITKCALCFTNLSLQLVQSKLDHHLLGCLIFSPC